MIFNHFKYLSPVWYFNLRPKKDWCYFSSPEQVKAAGLTLQVDTQYQSLAAQERDLAYRAFQIGFIDRDKKKIGLDIWETQTFPACDEYRFVRKNFNPIWVLYTLVLRILSFHNPIREIRGYWNSRDAQREDYAAQAVSYPDYETFESPLLRIQPLVSVIIPTLNRYTYLQDVFRDLEKQTYSHFEVIVVDQTDPFNESVYKGWQLNLRYWYQEEKALWRARNEAIQAAKGEFILLYDDDSLVGPDWIEHHLKTLDFFNADLSSGVSISKVGAKVPAHYAYFRWSDQLDTGNVLLKKDIFRQIGLFDRTFEGQRMGDGEFGLRAYLAGFRNISNPKAKRVHLKVGSGGLRQMGSWDAFRPKSLLAPRPVPSVLYFSRGFFGKRAAIYTSITQLPFSIIPYRLKRKKHLILLYWPIVLLLLPLFIFQFIKSWRIASKLLKQGPMIPDI